MAKNIQNSAQNLTNTFTKGLNKDSDPSFVSEGMWLHARNAVNNTAEGDLGTLSNESSNYLCITAGSTMPSTVVEKYIVGGIHLFSDTWVIYTAGHDINGVPIMSEIGLLEEGRCLYRPIVQDACLGFDKRFLISGSSREKEDCSWQVYWADGLNPDRYLNIGDPKTWPDPSIYFWSVVQSNYTNSVNFYTNYDVSTDTMLWPGVQWKQKCTPIDVNNPCEFCIDENKLDCDKIRLARLMQTPCLKLSLGVTGGTLRNGTYFATIAYSIKGQKITDYFSQSNYQFVYTFDDLQGSLDLEISADTENFDEFELVIVQCINNGTVAKRIGTYSTSTSRITLDQIKEDTLTVPLENIPLQTPVFEKSDQIAEVNNYLLRVGPTSKFDFNYQPLANLIRARWASVEYPANYYINGGNKTSYLRDEIYAFFIRWIYDTGDKSASYHIPGRPPKNFTIPGTTNTYSEDSTDYNGQNILYYDSTDPLKTEQVFEVYNTANILLPTNIPGTETINGQVVLPDGGIVNRVGEMGYWESTENYPDNQAEIWNSSEYCWTGQAGASQLYDLCGKKIRHHKFPDNTIEPHFTPNTNATGSQVDVPSIRILGVYFENIIFPKDNDGNDIPGIVGYEILRGSREGNRSVIAKGMINNFRTYEDIGDYNNTNSSLRTRGLYLNHPFNCIYPPYNTNDPNDHNYLYNDPFIRIPDPNDNDPLDSGGKVTNQSIPEDIISFHSPDTTFRNPFLSATEFKTYGYISGVSDQRFVEPSKHPQFKLISDQAWATALFVGFGEAILSLLGKRVYNQPGGSFTAQYQLPEVGGNTGPIGIQTNLTDAFTFYTQLQLYQAQQGLYETTGGFLLDAFTGTDVEQQLLESFNENSLSFGGNYTAPWLSIETNANTYLPSYLETGFSVLGAINKFAYYFSEGSNLTLDAIYAFLPYRQYALQQQAYGFYDGWNITKTLSDSNLKRFKIGEAFYLRDSLQTMPSYANNSVPGSWYRYKINNLKRSDTVVLRTLTGPRYNVSYPNGLNKGPLFLQDDESLVTVGQLGYETTPDRDFGKNIASYYGAIKVRLQNQYGQLDSIKQIVITPCEQKINYTDPNDINYFIETGPYQCTPGVNSNYTVKSLTKSPIFFGGDTYINRYAEKNTMFFFNDWLYDFPNGFEYNYLLRRMFINPRFWVNSQKYDVSEMSPANFLSPSYPGGGFRPRNFYQLDHNSYNYQTDAEGNYPPAVGFGVKNSYFYLANSSVRDFYVESDVLVDFREPGPELGERVYNPYNYTDIPVLFDMNPLNITKGDYYEYDYSLSVSKLYNQYFSSGNLQSRYYDPFVSKLCYTYFPDRIYYSLQQVEEAFKDSWFVYLPNNYKEFKSQISGVKSINKNGIFITFKNDSPLMYQGVDSLQTDLNTKITIGDGGLFSQPEQSVTNSDKPYEYGSSQNRLSVINTPAGLYYVSQNQAKIYQYGGNQLKEISQIGLKWWFTLFLPYKLLEDFPNYPWQDNPVSGIGIQSIYDNQNSILYFCKKDYKLKPIEQRPAGPVQYVPYVSTGKYKGRGDYFTVGGKGKYKIGDPALFESASWTISFDPKNNFWISFHDWHPDLVFPTKTTFLTSKANTLWTHNYVCDSFCNYYGKPYPFEIELPIITGQSVTTIKSIEYILECYKRKSGNCVDQFHVLDYNFDKAVIYNSEQVSGYLNLNIFPKNNVTLSLDYPKFNPIIPTIVDDSIVGLPGFDILFSKEENKYRFNQFWDTTKDRGEFPIGSGYPPSGPLVPGTTQLLGNYPSENIWITRADGYRKELNLANLDLTKSELQRKKFRHYLNVLHLKREISDNVNMIIKLTNSKNQISLR